MPVSHVTNEGGQNRVNYNKNAMDKIRQSLQNYHVSPSYDGNTLPVAATTHLANGGGVSSSASVATSVSDNMVRQVMLLGANEASTVLN